MKTDYEVVIIGAGVAGMTAAIYLKRSGISCCLLEREIPGGQINKSSSVQNYPGIMEITGPDLANNIFKQVNNLDIPYKYGNVLEIKVQNDKKIVKTDVEEISTKFIIIATGRISRKLQIANEEKLIGKGISYCALCDANFFKDQIVAVIGGSNAAMEEALYLSKICKKVIIIHRRNEFRADQILVDQVKNTSNIVLEVNAVPISFNSKDDRLSSITLNQNGKTWDLIVDGCFIYIGQVPASQIFKDIIEFDDDGYIIVDEHNCTNVAGIYAAGDIVKKDAYQLITAMSDGVIAAVNCIKNRNN